MPICFYRHRSLISSGKCCYVHVKYQKRSIEVLRRPVVDIGFTTKETRGRERRQGLPVLRPRASLPGSSPVVNLCSRIPWFPRFTSGLQTPGKCIIRTGIVGSDAFLRHVYEHNSRIYASHFCHPSHRTTVIYRLKISHLNIKCILLDLQRQFRELAKSRFFAICVRTMWLTREWKTPVISAHLQRWHV